MPTLWGCGQDQQGNIYKALYQPSHVRPSGCAGLFLGEGF